MSTVEDKRAQIKRKKEIIRDNQKEDYATIAALIIADGGEASRDGVRKMYRRMGLPPKTENVQYKQASPLGVDLDIFKRYLSMPRTLEEVSDHFCIPPFKAREVITELQDSSHHVFSIADDKISLGRDIEPIHQKFEVDFSKHKEVEVPIGFTADNHVGSKYERMEVLEDLFDRFQAAGVQTVYQGGNIIDGECRFNKFDIYAHGVNEQVANLIKKWPQREGITTQFVTGDDHEGWYVQREHINIGRLIEFEAREAGRNDLVHLGYMERDIALTQANGENATIRIIHAGGGSAYAHSYSSQKYAESLQGGEKPQIILVGHFHKLEYCYPREIHMIQGGCTQDQTPFMRKRKLQAMVGGVILWVKQAENGIIRSVKAEILPYYDKTFYQYRW